MPREEQPVYAGALVTYGGRTMLRAAGGEHVPGQDPVVPPVADPAPEPTVPAATGPWAKDLESSFEDPAVRSQVDAFLRSTVQPYSTQLEQKVSELASAQQLYSDLTEDPAETYLALTEELFGPEAAQKIRDDLTAQFGEEEEQAVTDQQPPALPPEDKETLEWAKQQRVKEAYDSEFARVKAAHPDVPAEEWDLFHPFVVSSSGNFDVAAQGFNQWRTQVEQRYAPPADPTPPDPAAPAVVGSETTTPPAPPIQQEYKNLDAAVDDFFAEKRAAAPPVVGSV